MSSQSSRNTYCCPAVDWICLAAVVLIVFLVADGIASVRQVTNGGLNNRVIFGKATASYGDEEFTGGRLLALFARNQVDLTRTTMTGGEAVVRADAILGKVEIRVPRNWDVRVVGSPVLGHYEDRTNPPGREEAEREGRLTVEGRAILGKVTVTN